jgi:hypothetical protein
MRDRRSSRVESGREDLAFWSSNFASASTSDVLSSPSSPHWPTYRFIFDPRPQWQRTIALTQRDRYEATKSLDVTPVATELWSADVCTTITGS